MYYNCNSTYTIQIYNTILSFIGDNIMKIPNKNVVVVKRPTYPKKAPKKIGELLDLYFLVDKQQKELQAELKKVSEELSKTADLITLHYKGADIHGARGNYCQGVISHITVFQAEDWSKVYNYIKKGRGDSRFDLLQKRLSSTAVRERGEEGIVIPGVKQVELERLSVRKLK